MLIENPEHTANIEALNAAKDNLKYLTTPDKDMDMTNPTEKNLYTDFSPTEPTLAQITGEPQRHREHGP